MPQTMPDRFREWYDYERDCNAKTVAMLESVPADRRSDPDYTRALRKLAHLVAARWMWLWRLGRIDDHPPSRDWFPDRDVEDIRHAVGHPMLGLGFYTKLVPQPGERVETLTDGEIAHLRSHYDAGLAYGDLWLGLLVAGRVGIHDFGLVSRIYGQYGVASFAL